MRVEEDRNLPGDKNVTIPRQVRGTSDMEILVHIGILVATKYFGSQKILTKITAILSCKSLWWDKNGYFVVKMS